MNEFQIRSCRTADENEVTALWEACRHTTPRNDPCRDIKCKLKVDPEWFLVGMIGGGIVAACMADYEGHRGWIHCLAVSPVFQRNTYATAVMKTAENRFREAGCPKINLQIRENNVNVCRFYVKIGFALDCVVSMGKRIDPE